MADYLKGHAAKQCPGCFGFNTQARPFMVQFPGTEPERYGDEVSENADAAVHWWSCCNDCDARWTR